MCRNILTSLIFMGSIIISTICYPIIQPYTPGKEINISSYVLNNIEAGQNAYGNINTHLDVLGATLDGPDLLFRNLLTFPTYPYLEVNKIKDDFGWNIIAEYANIQYNHQAGIRIMWETPPSDKLTYPTYSCLLSSEFFTQTGKSVKESTLYDLEPVPVSSMQVNEITHGSTRYHLISNINMGARNVITPYLINEGPSGFIGQMVITWTLPEDSPVVFDDDQTELKQYIPNVTISPLIDNKHISIEINYSSPDPILETMRNVLVHLALKVVRPPEPTSLGAEFVLLRTKVYKTYNTGKSDSQTNGIDSYIVLLNEKEKQDLKLLHTLSIFTSDKKILPESITGKITKQITLSQGQFGIKPISQEPLKKSGIKKEQKKLNAPLYPKSQYKFTLTTGKNIALPITRFTNESSTLSDCKIENNKLICSYNGRVNTPNEIKDAVSLFANVPTSVSRIMVNTEIDLNTKLLLSFPVQRIVIFKVKTYPNITNVPSGYSCTPKLLENGDLSFHCVMKNNPTATKIYSMDYYNQCMLSTNKYGLDASDVVIVGNNRLICNEYDNLPLGPWLTKLDPKRIMNLSWDRLYLTLKLRTGQSDSITTVISPLLSCKGGPIKLNDISHFACDDPYATLQKPVGDYLTTCSGTGTGWNGTRLLRSCLDLNGRSVNSGIIATKCLGTRSSMLFNQLQVSNYNGHLICAPDPNWVSLKWIDPCLNYAFDGMDVLTRCDKPVKRSLYEVQGLYSPDETSVVHKLNISKCAPDRLALNTYSITNVNGFPACVHPLELPMNLDNSCKDIVWNGYTAHATCLNSDGKYVETSLDVTQAGCKLIFSNDNINYYMQTLLDGNLQCIKRDYTMEIYNFSGINFSDCTVTFNGKSDDSISQPLRNLAKMVIDTPYDKFSMFQLDCTTAEHKKYRINLNDAHFFGLQGGTYPKGSNSSKVFIRGFNSNTSTDHLVLNYASSSNENNGILVSSDDSKTIDVVG